MACVVCGNRNTDERSNSTRPQCERCYQHMKAGEPARRAEADRAQRAWVEFQKKRQRSWSLLDQRLANSGPQDAPSALSEMRSEKEDRRR